MCRKARQAQRETSTSPCRGELGTPAHTPVASALKPYVELRDLRCQNKTHGAASVMSPPRPNCICLAGGVVQRRPRLVVTSRATLASRRSVKVVTDGCPRVVQRRLRIQHVALDHNWCRWNFDHGAFHVTRRCFGRGTCVSWGQHCGMRELTAVAAKRCDFSIRCSRRDCPVRAGIRSALTGLLSGEDTGRRCDQRDRKKASLYSNPAGTEPDRPRRPLADAGGHMEFSTSSWRASLQVLS